MYLFHGCLLYLPSGAIPGSTKDSSKRNPFLRHRASAEQEDQALRKILWNVIVENKSGLGEETAFDFKYIPDLSKKTEMEDAPETGMKQPGIERQNLQAFVLACGLLGTAGFMSFKIAVALVRKTVTAWLS